MADTDNVDIVMEEKSEIVIEAEIQHKEYSIKSCFGSVIVKHPVEKKEEMVGDAQEEEKTE
ncbi:MAG: hypothetical protein GTO02_21475 [Candidatus Dadabacteria bacterium]|nr:hypothetical protein [Candidatus Dadabacteria bacterium]